MCSHLCLAGVIAGFFCPNGLCSSYLVAFQCYFSYNVWHWAGSLVRRCRNARLVLHTGLTLSTINYWLFNLVSVALCLNLFNRISVPSVLHRLDDFLLIDALNGSSGSSLSKLKHCFQTLCVFVRWNNIRSCHVCWVSLTLLKWKHPSQSTQKNFLLFLLLLNNSWFLFFGTSTSPWVSLMSTTSSPGYYTWPLPCLISAISLHEGWWSGQTW